MLETIREFASERLADQPDLAAAARLAHATYFTDLAQRKLTDAISEEGTTALAGLTAETENLRTAWRYWVAAEDLDQLNRLIESLWLVYHVEGRYQATADITTELLDILGKSPSSPERSLQEVKLRTGYARALMTIKGYTAEVEDAYAEALALFEGQRTRAEIYPVLRDLARFYIGGAEIPKAADVGREILELAEAQDDQLMRLDGHLIIGTVLMFAGDLEGSLAQLDQGIGAFEAPNYRARRLRMGTDPRVSCLAASGFVLWMIGYPDRAVERSNRGGRRRPRRRPVLTRRTGCSTPGSCTCGGRNPCRSRSGRASCSRRRRTTTSRSGGRSARCSPVRRTRSWAGRRRAWPRSTKA